ncbi:hypothetical protein UQW22_17350 [Isoptericola halotolerans]|uniref:MmcQ/YjbR family DNA-binding protein n=1 Tax=Isoptericola halotolerans TaxID=300560 RepID=UPI00388F056B
MPMRSVVMGLLVESWYLGRPVPDIAHPSRGGVDGRRPGSWADAPYDDVARLALALPGAAEGTSRGWRVWQVAGRQFVWERPFTQADLRRSGDDPVPGGPILAAAVEDLGEKEAVLAAHRGTHFTIPHLDGYAAVLMRLDAVGDGTLAETVEDAWLARAPRGVAEDHRAS